MTAPEREALVKRLRRMAERQGEDYIWRTAKAAADMIEALSSPAVTVTEGWQPIETAPRDATVLVAVEATQKNNTFFGSGRKTHPAYIDEQGRVCDATEWAPDSGLNGPMWQSTHWQPLPPPPSTTPQTGSQE